MKSRPLMAPEKKRCRCRRCFSKQSTKLLSKTQRNVHIALYGKANAEQVDAAMRQLELQQHEVEHEDYEAFGVNSRTLSISGRGHSGIFEKDDINYIPAKEGQPQESDEEAPRPQASAKEEGSHTKEPPFNGPNAAPKERHVDMEVQDWDEIEGHFDEGGFDFQYDTEDEDDLELSSSEDGIGYETDENSEIWESEGR